MHELRTESRHASSSLTAIIVALAFALARPLFAGDHEPYDAQKYEAEQARKASLIAALANPDEAVRATATAEIVRLGDDMIGPLLQARRAETRPDVLGRILPLIRRSVRIDARVRPLRAEVRVGEPLDVELVLHNSSGVSVPVLPYTSDGRLVGCRVQILDEHGVEQRLAKPISLCGNSYWPEAELFVWLEPRGEVDAFGPTACRDIMLQYWRPERPGRYTIHARYMLCPDDFVDPRTIDRRGATQLREEARDDLSDEAAKLAELLPRGWIEAAPATVTAAPAK